MRIAVVGGNGFIGKEFVRFASERGHEPVVIGSDLDAFSEAGRREIRELLSTVDAMVFLAAKRPTAAFSLEEYLYNIRLAGAYFECAMECGVKNVVVTSSLSVYSSEALPWKEEECQCPLSLYGASKQAVDGLALHYNNAHDMRIKSLRLAQVIGTGEHKGFLLNTLIDNAIAGKKQTIFGAGVGKRQYIYVKDVCDALLHCVVAKGETAGIFNIGMDENVSIIHLAEIVNEVFGNEAGIEIRPDQPEDTRQYLMDVSRMRQELNWEPGYDLRKTFEDIARSCAQES